MDSRYIVIGCFGALALFLCFFAGFFTKTEKVKTFIALKSLASFSYVILALVACNFVFKTYAYSLFIIGGLAAFMLSTIVRAIPTRSDMFRTFYTYIEGFGFGMMVVSFFFLMNLPLIGFIVGGVAFIAYLITYLVVRKKDTKKDKLANLFLQLIYSFLLGIAINYAIAIFTIQSILLAFGALVCGAYVTLQTFTTFTNKKCVIAKNVLLGVGLILLALSIFFI